MPTPDQFQHAALAELAHAATLSSTDAMSADDLPANVSEDIAERRKDLQQKLAELSVSTDLEVADVDTFDLSKVDASPEVKAGMANMLGYANEMAALRNQALKDKPIEEVNSDFEAMALNEEPPPPLTDAELEDFSKQVEHDHALDSIQIAEPIVMPDEALVSPTAMALAGGVEDYSFLNNPMPLLQPNGDEMPLDDQVMPPPPQVSAEDQLAINEFMTGKRKELTPLQKNILVGQLLKNGNLDAALQGRSSSPALNSLFADMRRLQKQYPLLFGRHVHIKKRTSKARDKKKKGKKH
jgi:hypothetical protein